MLPDSSQGSCQRLCIVIQPEGVPGCRVTALGWSPCSTKPIILCDQLQNQQLIQACTQASPAQADSAAGCTTLLLLPRLATPTSCSRLLCDPTSLLSLFLGRPLPRFGPDTGNSASALLTSAAAASGLPTNSGSRSALVAELIEIVLHKGGDGSGASAGGSDNPASTARTTVVPSARSRVVRAGNNGGSGVSSRVVRAPALRPEPLPPLMRQGHCWQDWTH